MACELNQKIWAVILFDRVVRYKVTYKRALACLEKYPDKQHEITIVTIWTADKMMAKCKI